MNEPTYLIDFCSIQILTSHWPVFFKTIIILRLCNEMITVQLTACINGKSALKSDVIHVELTESFSLCGDNNSWNMSLTSAFKNKCCGLSLKLPGQGSSTDRPQHASWELGERI